MKNVISANGEFPLCGWHSDCFAHRNGYCAALTDTDFRRGRCPFYATAEQYRERQLAAAKSLATRARSGTLKMYGAPDSTTVSPSGDFFSENDCFIRDLREMETKAKELETSMDVDAIWGENDTETEDEDWE